MSRKEFRKITEFLHARLKEAAEGDADLAIIGLVEDFEHLLSEQSEKFDAEKWRTFIYNR
jgi:hypothetical protein